jgi:hypothetical protein
MICFGIEHQFHLGPHQRGGDLPHHQADDGATDPAGDADAHGADLPGSGGLRQGLG